jgi:hypothetical protein
MKLTKEERDVMEHVVLDPDGWLDHVVKTFGEAKAREFLDAKVSRHKTAHDKAKAAEGVNYKNRVKRDEEEMEITKAAMNSDEAKIQREIFQLIRAQAIKNLQSRGDIK